MGRARIRRIFSVTLSFAECAEATGFSLADLRRFADDGRTALTAFAALTRAREAAPIPTSSEADRPAPAGSAALRLVADVDSSC